MGYTFDFIEGEMWEKSPFSILDFTKQRKRWYQGVLLVVHSKELPWSKRIFLACQVYNYIFLPLLTSNILFSSVYPVPYPAFIDYVSSFITAVSVYMFIFGVIKSVDVKRVGLVRFAACLCSIVFVIPINVLLENIASVWSIIGKKHQFDIVDKKIKLMIN
ncbi:beta-1,4-mannosyltransferase egh-like [Agrilus planipennis]|nr:beta-1,4-mannosyltransferase egh-like [Agrilus planipennis]XP_025836526.1 beta-1,4-mannosyltransferase egh-like [Agrilus planipennis]